MDSHGKDRALLSRRALMAALGIPLLRYVGADSVYAQPLASPPVFRTGRRQFTVLEPADTLPTVTLADLKGRPATLAPSPGKVLLINIWASWCAACQTDLPLMERFHKARPDIAVAAVSIDRIAIRHNLEQYLSTLGVRSLPIYLDRTGALVSDGNAASAPLWVAGMPITYLITPSGTIAGYIQGVSDWLSEDAQKLLDFYAAA